jgi:hypothetical protein
VRHPAQVGQAYGLGWEGGATSAAARIPFSSVERPSLPEEIIDNLIDHEEVTDLDNHDRSVSPDQPGYLKPTPIDRSSLQVRANPL